MLLPHSHSVCECVSECVSECETDMCLTVCVCLSECVSECGSIRVGLRLHLNISPFIYASQVKFHSKTHPRAPTHTVRQTHTHTIGHRNTDTQTKAYIQIHVSHAPIHLPPTVLCLILFSSHLDEILLGPK